MESGYVCSGTEDCTHVKLELRCLTCHYSQCLCALKKKKDQKKLSKATGNQGSNILCFRLTTLSALIRQPGRKDAPRPVLVTRLAWCRKKNKKLKPMTPLLTSLYFYLYALRYFSLLFGQSNAFITHLLGKSAVYSSIDDLTGRLLLICTIHTTHASCGSADLKIILVLRRDRLRADG